MGRFGKGRIPENIRRPTREFSDKKDEKQRRRDRIKIRKSWPRNPGTQVHNDESRELPPEQEQIQEGLEEYEEGL